MTENFIEVRNLKKQFPVKGGVFQRQVATVDAVDGVDIDIRSGEAVGLVVGDPLLAVGVPRREERHALSGEEPQVGREGLDLGVAGFPGCTLYPQQFASAYLGVVDPVGNDRREFNTVGLDILRLRTQDHDRFRGLVDHLAQGEGFQKIRLVQ